jgi:hypothetical protein
MPFAIYWIPAYAKHKKGNKPAIENQDNKNKLLSREAYFIGMILFNSKDNRGRTALDIERLPPRSNDGVHK